MESQQQTQRPHKQEFFEMGAEAPVSLDLRLSGIPEAPLRTLFKPGTNNATLYQHPAV